MQRSSNNRWTIVSLIIIIAALALAGCGQTSTVAASKIEPAKLEPIAGTEFNQVILTERAAQRLDIQTAPVRQEQVNGTPRLVIPYAAVLYDLYGETWVYANPELLTFVREPITVDYIEDELAVLVDGPPAGTEVVIVGVAELYGADTGVGK